MNTHRFPGEEHTNAPLPRALGAGTAALAVALAACSGTPEIRYFDKRITNAEEFLAQADDAWRAYAEASGEQFSINDDGACFYVEDDTSLTGSSVYSGARCGPMWPYGYEGVGGLLDRGHG